MIKIFFFNLEFFVNSYFFYRKFKMASRLKIDKKYYLLDNELSNYKINSEDDPNLVNKNINFNNFE